MNTFTKTHIIYRRNNSASILFKQSMAVEYLQRNNININV